MNMAHALTHRNVNVRDHDNDHDTMDNGHEHAVVNKDLQYTRFGGFHFGAAFFGWLVATGLSTMLTALLAAAGSAVALSTVDTVTSGTATTVGLLSGLLFLLALGIAYYAGGYVAGRMARFDGARQGVGVWAIGLILTIVLGVLGAAIGSQYNLLQQLNLPALPVDGSSFTTGGLITGILAVLVTLMAAILGGKAGERYHNRIDATGEVDTVTR
jgi:hypothetical protein